MMQRSTWTRLALTVLATATMAAAACSSDTTDTTPLAPTTAKGSVTPAGTDTTSNPSNPTHPDSTNTPPAAPTPTSNGPVASVKLTPATGNTQVGWYLAFTATPLDANGVKVAGKTATWTVADGNILVMTDTGIARGKSVGTTKVYGTIDGHTDSATVTVIASVAPPTTPYTPVDSTPATPAASFSLTVHVDGALPGTDTSKVENLGGAKVILIRVGDTHGDTLSLSAPAGSSLTDSNGMASFTGLAGGSYTVQIDPPSGTPYDALTGGFGPVTTSNEVLTFTLHRKS